jgi:polyisoprenoid-binding protein YceI
MTLHPGTHALGPSAGRLEVHTFREGLAQRIGHDLVIEVTRWEATVEVSADGRPTAITLDADGRSLEVREGKHGVKALTDSDRQDIKGSIDKKILHGKPIAFRSRDVTTSGDALAVDGELTLDETTKPARFDVGLSPDGRLTGTLPVVQTTWGITPYKGLMGALKVRDELEVVLDVQLPAA